MKTHRLRRTAHFAKSHSKLVRNNTKLLDTIDATLRQLTRNPFEVSLRTHKVSNPLFGRVYSSRVTGDLRIIWAFDRNRRLILILLEIGGHDDVY